MINRKIEQNCSYYKSKGLAIESILEFKACFHLSFHFPFSWGAEGVCLQQILTNSTNNANRHWCKSPPPPNSANLLNTNFALSYLYLINKKNSSYIHSCHIDGRSMELEHLPLRARHKWHLLPSCTFYCNAAPVNVNSHRRKHQTS